MRRVFFPEAGPPELRVFFPEAGPPELVNVVHCAGFGGFSYGGEALVRQFFSRKSKFLKSLLPYTDDDVIFFRSDF